MIVFFIYFGSILNKYRSFQGGQCGILKNLIWYNEVLNKILPK